MNGEPLVPPMYPEKYEMSRLRKVLAAGWSAMPVLRRRKTLQRMESKIEHYRLALSETREGLLRELAVSSALRDLYQPLISADTTIDRMAHIFLDRARSITGSAHGYVSSIDPGTGRVLGHTITPMKGEECRIPFEERPFEFGTNRDGFYTGLWGHALNTREPFLTNSPESHPSSSGQPTGHIRIERFLSVPILLDDKLAGQIALSNPPADYTQRDLRAVRRLAQFYALALQRKETQEKTQAALREKEVLLREIHHRVKNNLQVISSLLNLQARILDHPQALEMLKESQNRVRSMAMVHEQLHRSRDLSRIHFGEYVRNLAASLFCSYGVDSARVALRVDVDEVYFGINTAIPCGLMIQEIVYNSLKHAFPSDQSGEIRIALQSEVDDHRVLVVEDNGIGLPRGVKCCETDSLGLRLVRIFVEQVDGTASCESDEGLRFEIKIPRIKNEEVSYYDEQRKNPRG